MRSVQIDSKMHELAKIESKKRNKYISHHFDVAHLSPEKRDEIGFLGEFACCKLLNIDYEQNIRENYLTIDDFDLVYKGKRVDVKTETIPSKYIDDIKNNRITNDQIYGRRLIHENQYPLLHKYDVVVFGFFERNNYNLWSCFGFLETKHILANYSPQKYRPYGGEYPFKAAAIRLSDLKDMSLL